MSALPSRLAGGVSAIPGCFLLGFERHGPFCRLGHQPPRLGVTCDLCRSFRGALCRKPRRLCFARHLAFGVANVASFGNCDTGGALCGDRRVIGARARTEPRDGGILRRLRRTFSVTEFRHGF